MRIRPLPLVLAFGFVFSLACNNADEPTVTPVDGAWNYFPDDVDNNTCPANIIPIVDVMQSFDLDFDGGDGFQVDMGDEMDIVCNLTGGQNFACPDRLYSTSEIDELNLELEFWIHIEGVFENDAEAIGTRYLSVRCTGDGCGALDDIPCSADLEFHAEAL